MPQLAIVADDLTGAADTSACFADAGYSTVISLGGASPPVADVLALTTESRDLPASDAARVVGDAVSVLRGDSGGDSPAWIYKKIDSALRGHPRDELLAAMDATGKTRAILAPALPAEGRTTVAGRQLIAGLPLEESLFGGSGATSDLRRVFANNRGLPVNLLSLNTIRSDPEAISRLLDDTSPGILIADAETDADLEAIARAVGRSAPRLLCGAAGFARLLAPVLPLVAATPVPVPIRQERGPVLVVAGSQHAATERQLASLRAAGVPVIGLTQTVIDDPEASIAPIAAEVAASLAIRSPVAITTVGLAPSSNKERSVASRLAEIVANPAVTNQIGGLVLTGGDVAAAVCDALGATALWLGGEIYAGQPWGLLGRGTLPGLPIATKAGSFGRDDALLACIKHLEKAHRLT
jgi:uncharacterized protein YgbK (DUF1537 family)